MSGSHEEMTTLAAAYSLGALEPEERAGFESHLSSCQTCREEVRTLSPVVAGLALAVPQITPRPELRARVLDAVGGSRREAGNPHARATSSLLTWLPLAAMLAISIGMGVYAVGLRRRVADLEGRLADASSRLLVADRAVNDARRVALETQSATAVLAAPDLVRIDLNGENGAPDAKARALWSRQRGMVFTATNLPPLPAGRTYQVWVVTANAPLSAGLLEPDANGRAMGTFNTPPDIPPPVAVAVTVEPLGGVPAPTGPRYLLGTPAI